MIRINPTGKSSPGVTTMEYGMILFVGCVLGIVGIKVLGVSDFNVLWKSGEAVEKQNTLSLLTAKPAGESSGQSLGNENGNGGNPNSTQGYYTLVTDSATGQPVLKLADGSEGQGTNVSSIEGTQQNVLGTLMISEVMSRLADAETNPKTAVYYQELAKRLFYTGSVEGALDELPGLDNIVDDSQNGRAYTKADALKDILDYRDALKDLLNHPPVGVNASDIARIRPLVNDALRIAQKYVNEYNQYIRKNDKIDKKVNQDSGSHGTEKPANQSLDEMVSYSTIKAMAHRVLSDNHINSDAINTLQDAVSTEAAATTTGTTASTTTAPAPASTEVTTATP